MCVCAVVRHEYVCVPMFVSCIKARKTNYPPPAGMALKKERRREEKQHTQTTYTVKNGADEAKRTRPHAIKHDRKRALMTRTIDGYPWARGISSSSSSIPFFLYFGPIVALSSRCPVLSPI